jgi:hypothetical protein
MLGSTEIAATPVADAVAERIRVERAGCSS